MSETESVEAPTVSTSLSNEAEDEETPVAVPAPADDAGQVEAEAPADVPAVVSPAEDAGADDSAPPP